MVIFTTAFPFTTGLLSRYLGLFHCLSPTWRPKNKSTKYTSHRSEPPIRKPRNPPDRYRRGCLAILFLHLCIVFINTNAVFLEYMPISSLSALPLTLFTGTSIQVLRQRENYQAICILFAPFRTSSIHDGQFLAEIFPSNDGTLCNATELSMLSAWQSANAHSPIYMDYAPGSKAICIDTGASSCISNDRNDFISLEKVQNQTITGIGSSLDIAGYRTLRWRIKDDDGNTIVLHVRYALYVPKVPMCLLCPQQIAQQTA